MIKSTGEKIPCFKAYDIRGRVPDELDEALSEKIGHAFACHFKPQTVAVGHDIRLSSPAISNALAKGFLDSGVDVIDLGMCGTEEIYFAAASLDVDGGIIVTASHNPVDWNGMKMVLKDAVPVSGDSGLRELERLVVTGIKAHKGPRGQKRHVDNRKAYIRHLLTYIDLSALKPLKVVMNAGNGCAGPVIDMLETLLPFDFIKIHHEPDGTFPNGVPNPLLPENRAITAEAVRENKADLGIAWDGDFDRCFFFDEQGRFIEGYYIVGLLAEAMLRKNPAGRIIHDPRLVWNTVKIVKEAGGIPVMSKTGHAFIKERMRRENAVYGGEMSAHHYFRDFSFCDSGMIPWLLVTELLNASSRRLSRLVDAMIEAFPVSGEINSVVDDPDAVIAEISKLYGAKPGAETDLTDGLSVAFPDFRFNIRKSNTEPLLRLNVETRGDNLLLKNKISELLKIIRG